MQQGSDPVRASVSHLLTRAYGLPCSTAAQAFTQLVSPTRRFQLALDALLPVLDPPSSSANDTPNGANTTTTTKTDPLQLSQRILVCFILYSLYASHPIAMNPFKSVLYLTYTTERQRALSNESSPNEQLVWVLWKILKGDGSDIGPYSPSTLAQSPLPPKLKVTNLTLDDITFINDFDPEDYASISATPYKSLAQPNDQAARAIVLLLDARTRTLTLSEQRSIIPLISQICDSRTLTSLDLAPIANYNPSIAVLLFSRLIKTAGKDELESYLHVLASLPPTLPTFDIWGRLLKDNETVLEADEGYTVARVVRESALGRFVHDSIRYLEGLKREEPGDDRWMIGVRNLCRFYMSLVKLAMIDVNSDAETTQMSQFALEYSKFEEANALYRTLINVKHGF